MNNEVMNFDHEVFGKLDVVIVEGQPMFIGKQCAEMLGYKNPRDALNKHVDEDEKAVAKRDTLGGKQKQTVISESGLYALILRSKLTDAKIFKRWVTKEVLPTIRKTGGYVSDVDQMVSTFFGGCSEEVQVVAKGLLTSVKENQHKVDFFNAVAEAENNIDVNAFAKILGTGRNKLFALLREEGYIIQNSTLPYERYKTAQKWFSVIETTKNGRVYTKTLVTPKGQIELEKRLRDKLAA